jgi:hypothetical protein
MKRKRQAAPVLAIPVTPVVVKGDATGNESLAEFRRRYNREQREQSDAKTAQMIGELNDTVLQLRSAQRDALFKIPSEELSALTIKAPEYLTESVEETRTQIKSAIHSVLVKLTTEGFDVQDSARDKMVKVANLNLTVDWRVAANWRKLFDYMLDLGALGAEVTPPRKPEPPAPRVTLDDLENETDERKSKRLANEIYYDERQPTVRAWYASLMDNFGFAISADDIKRCKTWFERNGKSFLDLRHYDECRRWNVSAGYWPETMLAEDERLSRDLDAIDTANMSFDQKQELRTKLLQQQQQQSSTSRKPVVSEEDRTVIAQADKMTADELRVRLNDKAFAARLELAYTRTGR